MSPHGAQARDAQERRRCVLVAEDEMALAMLVEDILDDAGYRVLKAARVPAAVQLATDATIDAAILDINLGGTMVFPVAARLRQRGIPFLFASGYGKDGIPAEYAGYPVLQKPYLPPRLQAMLAQVLAVGPPGQDARPQAAPPPAHT